MRRILLVLGVLAIAGIGGASEASNEQRSDEKSQRGPQPGNKTKPEPRHEEAPPFAMPKDTRQALVVRTRAWSSVTGTLDRFERSGKKDWHPVGSPAPLNVGRNGMAWGHGLLKGVLPGPLKREGDGRSPAGVFALGRAFGTADELPEGSNGFPYLRTQPSTYCVENTRSKLYNQIVDAPGVTPGSRPGWSELQRADGLFRWGIIVRQNDTDTQIGAGSCVFLHIWRGAGKGTAGCTAMESEALRTTLRWLDPTANPLLIELPEPVYQDVREAWQLP